MYVKSDDAVPSGDKYAVYNELTEDPERFNDPVHTHSDHYHDYFLALHCAEAYETMELIVNTGCQTNAEC